ncbi:MAG: hypothetical protein ABI128_11600 [Rhodanobacter sp.]
MLFSALLDTSKITVRCTLVFSVFLRVSSTGCSIDNKLWLDGHGAGE